MAEGLSARQGDVLVMVGTRKGLSCSPATHPENDGKFPGSISQEATFST